MSTAETAIRVLRDKAGLEVRVLEQLMTFSGPNRDPRGWSISAAYYALLPEADIPKAGRNLLVPIPADRPGDLPFDHNDIVASALDRLKRRSIYSSLAAFLLPRTFTFSELRRAYETVFCRSLNDSAFRRKVDELCMIEPLPDAMSKVTARPAQLYRLKHEGVAEFDRTF